ncbi:hypothetical protein CEP53_008654 [Fusarium sp. AF-6]|nr:hypothetical protein CEP53_008654 [Fusarium sp. AF-6]
MTRKEYFDHRFHIHGSLSDSMENKDNKPQYVNLGFGPRPRSSKNIQTQVFGSAFGSRPDGPLNANQHWVGRDDTTELFFRDWDYVITCFSSEFVKTSIGPDGPLFADFETCIVLMAYETEERAKAGNADLDVGNATVAMHFISLPDDVRDGNRVGAIYDGASERAQREFEEAAGRQGFVDLHTQTAGESLICCSLKEFAFSWRSRIPSRSKQLTLDSFGFTSTKPPVQPWVPTSSTPEIPLDWLCEHPDVAWEFARTGYLFSRAPIPALLHTCTESRLELINMGYQLAFQTRSRGPRTWFNFDQDTLYLGDTLFLDPDLAQIEITEKRLQILNGLSAWDTGQFDPGEMRQVQKLALGGAAEHLSHRYFDEYDPDNRRQLSSVLRLFSRVEELLLVGWAAGDLTTVIAKCRRDRWLITSLLP